MLVTLREHARGGKGDLQDHFNSSLFTKVPKVYKPFYHDYLSSHARHYALIIIFWSTVPHILTTYNYYFITYFILIK